MSSLAVERLTPDFSGHSDLVVMLLGMKATSCRGLITLVSLLARRAVSKSIRKRPDGLLFAQNSVLYSLRPFHVGFRWYWRDQESMMAWAHSAPHLLWSASFSRDTRGTCFWHETYFMRGGMEAMYVNMDIGSGFQSFLPMKAIAGTFFDRHAASKPPTGEA